MRYAHSPFPLPFILSRCSPFWSQREFALPSLPYLTSHLLTQYFGVRVASTDCPGGGGGVGYFCQNRMWMCLPNLKNLTFSIPIFLPNYPPISIPFFDRKEPNFAQIGTFYKKFAQNTLNFWFWAPSSRMETHRSLYQISRKSTPKGRYTKSMWELPWDWLLHQNPLWTLCGCNYSKSRRILSQIIMILLYLNFYKPPNIKYDYTHIKGKLSITSIECSSVSSIFHMIGLHVSLSNISVTY